MTTATTTLAERLEESSVTVLLACSVLRRTSVNFIPRWWSDLAFDPNYRLKLHQRVSKEQQNTRVRRNGAPNELGYQYASLPQRHIRLLHIQPGNDGELIQCSLTTHVMDEAPDFEALSYTWGDPRRTRKILCDEKSIQVGFNLWEALQQLRHIERSRTMWIDAMCINQADLTERSEQVQLMDSIYRRATSVVVWLGAASRNSPAAFRLIREIHAIAEATSLEDLDKPLLAMDIEEMGLPERYSSDWEAFDSVFWRTWFKRVWIIQEVAVARSAVITCGEDSESWDTFAAVADFITRRQLYVLRNVNVSTLLPLFEVRNLCRYNVEISLLTLLASFRQSLATNPIDKVYALLNLASDVNLLPDYKMSPVDAFRRVCTIYLQRSLDILSLNGDAAWKHLRRLPSWVPDWSSPLQERPFLLGKSGLAFHAGGNAFPRLRVSEDGNTVSIIGKIIDQVQVRSNPLIHGHGATLRLIQVRSIGLKFLESNYNFAIALTLRSWERMILRLKRYPTDENIRTVLQKTLIANASLGMTTSSEEADLERVYSSFRKQFAMPLWSQTDVNIKQRDLDDASLYYDLLMNAAYGRRAFVSRHGYVGLCSFSTRRGDCVAVLNGGKTAYILRENHRNGTTNFTFVGEAYIHGFMDGEAFQDGFDTNDMEFAIV